MQIAYRRHAAQHNAGTQKHAAGGAFTQAGHSLHTVGASRHEGGRRTCVYTPPATASKEREEGLRVGRANGRDRHPPTPCLPHTSTQSLCSVHICCNNANNKDNPPHNPNPHCIPCPPARPAQQAASISSMDFWSYANTTIRGGYANASEYAADAGWVRNATCFCDAIANDTTASGPLFDSSLLYLNQSVSYSDPTQPFGLSLAQYKADPYYCPGESGGGAGGAGVCMCVSWGGERHRGLGRGDRGRQGGEGCLLVCHRHVHPEQAEAGS